jgi:hypothetical protein
MLKSLLLQVTWLSVYEATLITSSMVASGLAEGLGLKVFAVKAPLWASGDFVLLLLLCVVAAELVVNDARHLHGKYLALVEERPTAESPMVGASESAGCRAGRPIGSGAGAGGAKAGGGGGGGGGGGMGNGGCGGGRSVRVSRWWLDDLGRSVASVINIQPHTFRMLRRLGRFLQSVEPLVLLPVTLVAIVLCGLTPAKGRPADFMHLIDILVALSLLIWSLVSFRNWAHSVHRAHVADQEQMRRVRLQSEAEHLERDTQRQIKVQTQTAQARESTDGEDPVRGRGHSMDTVSVGTTTTRVSISQSEDGAQGVASGKRSSRRNRLGWVPKMLRAQEMDGLGAEASGEIDDGIAGAPLLFPHTTTASRDSDRDLTPHHPNIDSDDESDFSDTPPAALAGANTNSRFARLALSFKASGGRHGKLTQTVRMARMAAARMAMRLTKRSAVNGASSSMNEGSHGVSDAALIPVRNSRAHVRKVFQIYILVQCLYITGLYVFNVKYVNAAVHQHWPSSLHSLLVPDDIGLFDLPEYSGRAYLQALSSRVGTLVCVLFHKRWLDWMLYRDNHPLSLRDDDDGGGGGDDGGGVDLDPPQDHPGARGIEKSERRRNAGGGGGGGGGSSGETQKAARSSANKAWVFAEHGAYQAMRTMGVAYSEVRKQFSSVFGSRFESMVQTRAMDFLLLTVVCCIAAQVQP